MLLKPIFLYISNDQPEIEINILLDGTKNMKNGHICFLDVQDQ
jgi:hypothetical protein